MQPLIQEVPFQCPEALAERVRRQPGLVLLRTNLFGSAQNRYSLLAARPFLSFRSWDWRCELATGTETRVQFGSPWRVLGELMARYELGQEEELPFPLGGCFGYWGYELKQFVEPKLPRRAGDKLDLPDCQLGFYSSLVVFDHQFHKSWIISTGLVPDGTSSESKARAEAAAWQEELESVRVDSRELNYSGAGGHARVECRRLYRAADSANATGLYSNMSCSDFLRRVRRAQVFIRSGDIYQVNLSQRLAAPYLGSGWELFRQLGEVSPAPFSAYLDGGDFQIVSASPELFLRLSGRHVQTCPIKGTRPRDQDPKRDAQLANALRTSGKELAELVMITDLLRNDLGRISQYGSVHVPELARLERFPQVQHLVSTVEGRLLPELSHLAALEACFPGGSITGAPKFRAMEIIDELEPVSRGPYTGALGYLGFNGESQLSMLIRAAILKDGTAYFPVGAGIVADSDPAAEYAETLAKAAGFRAALETHRPRRSPGEETDSDGLSRFPPKPLQVGRASEP